jgi:hypothetical protein
MPFYRGQMSPNDAAKIFREKADAYLEMTRYRRRLFDFASRQSPEDSHALLGY